MKTTVYRNGQGKVLTLEELLKEPKFLAGGPPTLYAGILPVRNRPADGGPWDGSDINPKHTYTTTELGRKWNFHKDTVFDLFVDYPGVLKIAHPETRKRRGYTTIRIPASVAAKFWREHTNKAA